MRSRLVGLDLACEGRRGIWQGTSPACAFVDIVAPLIASAILSGVLLAFAVSLNVVISFFVFGAESTTFPVYVYFKFKTDVSPSINDICTIVFGVTLIVPALSRLPGRRKRRR